MVRDADPGPDACNLVSEQFSRPIQTRCYHVRIITLIVEILDGTPYSHLLPLFSFILYRRRSILASIPVSPRIRACISSPIPEETPAGLAIDFSTERPFLVC